MKVFMNSIRVSASLELRYHFRQWTLSGGTHGIGVPSVPHHAIISQSSRVEGTGTGHSRLTFLGAEKGVARDHQCFCTLVLSMTLVTQRALLSTIMVTSCVSLRVLDEL